MYLEVRQIDREDVQELLDASVFVAQGLALHDDMEVRLLARMEAINAKYAALHAAPNPERSDA